MNKLKIRIPVILLLLLVSSVSFAQNWNFIKTDERYHFKHKDDTIPLNTILIDSTKIEGNNTTNYLNRLFLPCDTCSSEGFYLDNQPGFLQREFVYSQVSSTIQLYNPEKYIIHLPDNEMKEWWFDEAETQKATLGSVTNENVFGIEDSIATINIDGEPKIKIAKNLGLIRYFDYELSGVENARLGKCLPGWKDFYDFEVGDVFMFLVEELYPESEYLDYYDKSTIQAIKKEKDRIIVSYNRKIRPYYYPYILECSEVNDRVEYINSFNHFTNTYPNQKVPVCSENFAIEIAKDCRLGNNEFCIIPKLGFDGSLYSTEIGFSIYSDNIGLFYRDSSNLFKEYGYNSDVFFGMEEQWLMEYKEGLGRTKESIWYFEGRYEKNMIGYIKNGSSSGTVYSDGYMTGINQNRLDQFRIYPNPSSGSLTFDLGIESKAKIEIYTLEGRLVEQFETKNNQIQNLQQLNSGIYIISIQQKDSLQQIKWIKQ